MVRSHSSISFFIALSATLILSGCGGEADPADRAAGVSQVKIINKSRDTVRAVVVTGVGSPISFAPLASGSQSSLRPDGELGGSIGVRWTDAKDQAQRRSVNVKQSLGDRVRGTVVITIERNGQVRASKG